MQNTQKGMVGIIFIIGIIVVGIFLYLMNLNVSGQPAAIVSDVSSPSEMFTADPVIRHNIEIQSAMVHFFDYGANNPDEYDFLCTSGGFINERNPELKILSDLIVSNRIIDPATGGFATTPDEAGITCLSDPEKWVLFAPFNRRASGNGPSHYCVDSTGANGELGIDRESIRCLN